MKPQRLSLLLALIVLLPLALLGWQSWTMQQDSQRMQASQAADIAALRLVQFDQQIQQYFAVLAQQLRSALASHDQIDRLAHLIRQDGRIRHIFVANPKVSLPLFPVANPTLSPQQIRFIERWQPVWQDPQRLNSTNPAAVVETQATTSRFTPLKTGSASYLVDAKKGIERTLGHTRETLRQGWISQYWRRGTHVLFWMQTPDDRLWGIELEPARIKADLIGLLPDTRTQNQDYRMTLRDSNQQHIYQWGHSFHEDSSRRTAITNKQLTLSAPLSSWTLHYQGTIASSLWGRYALLLVFASMVLVVMGLAYVLYREQSRNMRLAAQQVQFVSQVSHELKTPLTNVRMYAELLQDQLNDEPQQQRYLGIIIDEGQRLSRLIANVLNFARSPRIHQQPMVVDDIIQQIVDHFRPSLEAKQMSIDLNLHATQAILCDSDVLGQILNNLISNVEKYAYQGQYLGIRSQQTEQWVRIQVRDHGKGIDKREQSRIFQPFYRSHNQLNEGVSGTGIGLTIAQQQAERLGGHLSVVAPDDGGAGACFELTLSNT